MAEKTDSKLPPTTDEATRPATAEPDADVRAWQENEIRRAVEDADEGRFASPEDVKRVIRKYVPHGSSRLDRSGSRQS